MGFRLSYPFYINDDENFKLTITQKKLNWDEVLQFLKDQKEDFNDLLDVIILMQKQQLEFNLPFDIFPHIVFYKHKDALLNIRIDRQMHVNHIVSCDLLPGKKNETKWCSIN